MSNDDVSTEELVVTNDDQVLCRNCYEEGVEELDPGTHYFATTRNGECGDCGARLAPADDCLVNDVAAGILDTCRWVLEQHKRDEE